jgi:hypothetical protein
MKINILMTFFLLLFIPAFSGAEKFLEAPVIPHGEITLKTKSRLEITSEISHDDAVAFYKSALEGQEDIKYREWKDATYIEDDGKRPWHSVTISKGDKVKTTITIAKDSWTWIIGTLILRYIGVFVVLLVLYLGMYISGNIISKMIKMIEIKKAGS